MKYKKQEKPIRFKRNQEADGDFYVTQYQLMFDGGQWCNLQLGLLRIMPMDCACVISYLAMFASMQEGENKTDGRWFKCPSRRLQYRLNISRKKEERIMAWLENSDYIERRMSGSPAVRWIKIRFDMMASECSGVRKAELEDLESRSRIPQNGETGLPGNGEAPYKVNK